MSNARKTAAAPRLSHVMEEWLDCARGRLKPTTVAAYETIVRSHLKPWFGNLYPEEITAAGIEAFRREKAGEGLAPSTIRGIVGVLRSVARHGRRYGCDAGDEDFRGAAVGRSCDIATLSDDDQGKIVSLLGGFPSEKGLGVLICLLTGLRVGEICGLRWGDVAENCRSLTVRRTVSRMRCGEGTRLYVGEPKSQSSRRRIPLPMSLAVALNRARMPDMYYIVTNSPDRIPEPRCMQRYFSALLDSAQVERMKFHTLRHTFATRCVELGFDVKALSMILGHSSVTMTLNTYVHPSFERMRAMMELLDK